MSLNHLRHGWALTQHGLFARELGESLIILLRAVEAAGRNVTN